MSLPPLARFQSPLSNHNLHPRRKTTSCQSCLTGRITVVQAQSKRSFVHQGRKEEILDSTSVVRPVQLGTRATSESSDTTKLRGVP